MCDIAKTGDDRVIALPQIAKIVKKGFEALPRLLDCERIISAAGGVGGGAERDIHFGPVPSVVD